MNPKWKKARKRLTNTNLPDQGPRQGQAQPEVTEGQEVGHRGAERCRGEEAIQLAH